MIMMNTLIIEVLEKVYIIYQIKNFLVVIMMRMLTTIYPNPAIY